MIRDCISCNLDWADIFALLIVFVEIRLVAELLLLLFELELEDDDAVRATTPYSMSLSAACIDQQQSSSLLHPLSSLQFDGRATDIVSMSISVAVVTAVVADTVVMRRHLDVFVSGGCIAAPFFRQKIEMTEIELFDSGDGHDEVIDDGKTKNE